jgi:predicted DNA binding CopG/RHH family protein
MKLKLTKEERQIERDLLAGRFKPVSAAEHARYRRYAIAQVKGRKANQKDARVNIRLSADTLQQFKQHAEQEGLPYQSLLASLVYKYVNGSLVDVGNIAAIRRALRAG